jgi:hypothetical protein
MNFLEKVGLRKTPLTDLELADLADGHDDPDLAQWLRDRHERKLAEAEGQARAESNNSSMSIREARLVFYGISAAMTAGVLINPEAVKAMNEAKEVLGTNHEDVTPPRPPCRPNARIGGLAIENA